MKANNIKLDKYSTLFPRVCPICGSNKYNVLYEDNLSPNRPIFGYDFSPRAKKTYRIIQCLECSHAYCSPTPKDIYKDYIDVVDNIYLKGVSSRIKCSKKVIKVLL